MGDVSTGAQDDLAKATDLVRRMVRELEMSETLGVSTLEGGRPLSYAGAFGSAQTVCSDATLHAVDAEVSRILNEAHERMRAMMAQDRDVLERVAKRLLEAESLT